MVLHRLFQAFCLCSVWETLDIYIVRTIERTFLLRSRENLTTYAVLPYNIMNILDVNYSGFKFSRLFTATAELFHVSLVLSGVRLTYHEGGRLFQRRHFEVPAWLVFLPRCWLPNKITIYEGRAVSMQSIECCYRNWFSCATIWFFFLRITLK